MAVFTKSVDPKPYISMFPSNNSASVVRIDGFRMSCIQDTRNINLHIEYTPARLYKNKCLDCKYLEITPDLNQTGSVEDRTCKGFYKMSRYEYPTCIKQYKDTDLEVLTIDIPPIMWTVNSSNEFRLYTIKTVGGVLYKTPYTLANVYTDGHICWGRQNKAPGSLLEASIKFWSLPFNYDLMSGNRESGDLITKLSTFKLPNDDATVLNHWQDCSDIFGNASLFKNKQTDGASIWFNEEILSLLPTNKVYDCKRILSNGTVLTKCAVGWIKRLPSDSYLIDFGGFQIVKDKLTIKSKAIVLGNVNE